jgi:hypothetical protein
MEAVLSPGQRPQPPQQPEGSSGMGSNEESSERTRRGKSQQRSAMAPAVSHMPSAGVPAGQYGMVQAPQPAFWPESQPVYATGLHQLIINQIHYYFSPENLYRDDFLRGQMDPTEGWLPLQLLATFNRLRSLSADVNVIAEVTPRSPAPSLARAGPAARLRARSAPRGTSLFNQHAVCLD